MTERSLLVEESRLTFNLTEDVTKRVNELEEEGMDPTAWRPK
jgi:hypothetical protein